MYLDPLAAVLDSPRSHEIARNGSSNGHSTHVALTMDDSATTESATNEMANGVEADHAYDQTGRLNGSAAGVVERAYNGNGHAYLELAPSSSDVLITGRSEVPVMAPPPAELPVLLTTEPVAEDVTDSVVETAVPPHPHSGSLFVPYLVTEIRELRSRQQRRTGFWRRIFG